MRRRISSTLAAAVLLAMTAQAVSADALVADGDGLAPVSGARMDLGTICHGTATTSVALLAVRATGHPNNRQVFDNGSTVTTTMSVLSGPGLTATATVPGLVMASDWRSQPNQTLSAPVVWDISVTPDALGRYRGRLQFRAEGLNRHGATITRTGQMNVIARVVDCTPPVIDDLPGDVTLEAGAADGVDFAYVPPTATDAVDGAVTVDCDLPASSRVPIGVTIVVCTARDRASNEASASFNVTVADTTAPRLDGVPSGLAVTAGDESGAGVDWLMPTASDLVDGPVSVACDPAPGSLFAIGLTTVDCSATDAAGNTATGSFTVEVVAPPAPDPLPEEIVAPSEPPAADPESDLAAQDETAGDGSSPAPAPSQVTSAPTEHTVLPNTSATPGTPASALGLLLVAMAAVCAAVGRRVH